MKREAYVFVLVRYPDLEAFSVDLRARMLAGVSAIVAGRLKRLPELDPLQAHPRRASNFDDDPSWLLQLDFDGLAAADARRIDRPEDFGAVTLREARQRLSLAFDTDCVLYATSSTGLPFNAKGEPANGRARFRLVFPLSRPLTFAEQSQIVLALGRRRGLSCLDMSIYVLPQFSFVARPVFPSDMNDPIERPVSLYEGAKRRVDVDALLSELPVDLTPEPRGGTHSASGRAERAEGRLLHVDPAIRYELVERLMAAIPNNLEREKWIGVAHALQGVFGDNYRGREIWLAFCERRLDGEIDPDEDERGPGTFSMSRTDMRALPCLFDWRSRWARRKQSQPLRPCAWRRGRRRSMKSRPKCSTKLKPTATPRNRSNRDGAISWLRRGSIATSRRGIISWAISSARRRAWLMFGETGVGKTLLTLDMAAAIASGRPMLGWAGQRATRVMYLDGELPAETFKERMQLIAGALRPGHLALWL